jgi:hypothetical protein
MQKRRFGYLLTTSRAVVLFAAVGSRLDTALAECCSLNCYNHTFVTYYAQSLLVSHCRWLHWRGYYT